MTTVDWQEVEAISTTVTAVSVIGISGLAAFWAWYRDPARLRIYRFGNNWPVQIPIPLGDIRQVGGMEGFANIGVIIVNSSLMPSGIVGAGFDFCGQPYWFREPEILDERTPLHVVGAKRRKNSERVRHPWAEESGMAASGAA